MNKYVTMFYFFWHDFWVNQGHTQLTSDVSHWDRYKFYWWGKPAFVRSVADYRFVLNNGQPNRSLIEHHADQLAHVGIDFITLDATNANYSTHDFIAATKAIIQVYHERLIARKATPQVVFFFGGYTSDDLFNTYLQFVIDQFYSPFPAQLFFHYQNKPLILVVGGWGQSSTALGYFTVRRASGYTYNSEYWSFKQETLTEEQAHVRPYYHEGWPEEMSVVPATGLPMSDPNVTVGRRGGQTFREQWDRVFGVNPTFVFVCSWNEWGAQFIPDVPQDQPYDPAVPRFIDEYNQEYSADIEPMAGGHGDRYLRDLELYIRRYKRNSPNFVYRDPGDGRWYFKNYRRNYSARRETNFIATLDWTQAIGEHYQPLIRNTASGDLDFIALRDPSNGVWHFRLHRGNYDFSGSWSIAWDATGGHYQPFILNLRGNAFAIGLRDPSNGAWHFRKYLGGQSFDGSVSIEWPETADRGYHYQALAQNFGSQNDSVIGVRNIDDGYWMFRKRISDFAFGDPITFRWEPTTNYFPLVGDYDGDGVIDIALRQANGKIHIANNNGSWYFHHQNTFWGPEGSQLQFCC